MSAQYHKHIYTEGDTKGIEFIKVDENNAVEDVSDYIFELTIKNYSDENDDNSGAIYNYIMETSLYSNPETGIFTFPFEESDTLGLVGIYKMDLQMTYPNGTKETVLIGDFIIEPEVTK